MSSQKNLNIIQNANGILRRFEAQKARPKAAFLPQKNTEKVLHLPSAWGTFRNKFSASQKAPPWVCQFVVLGSLNELGIVEGVRSSLFLPGNKRATRPKERMTIGLFGDGPALGVEIGKQSGHQNDAQRPRSLVKISYKYSLLDLLLWNPELWRLASCQQNHKLGLSGLEALSKESFDEPL